MYKQIKSSIKPLIKDEELYKRVKAEIKKVVGEDERIPIKKAQYDKLYKEIMEMRIQANRLSEDLTDLVPEEKQSADDPASQLLAVFDILDDVLRGFSSDFKIKAEAQSSKFSAEEEKKIEDILSAYSEYAYIEMGVEETEHKISKVGELAHLDIKFADKDLGGDVDPVGVDLDLSGEKAKPVAFYVDGKKGAAKSFKDAMAIAIGDDPEDW